MAAILPAYDIHKCIFLNDNCCQMSSKFVAQNPIGNKSALHDSGIGLAPTIGDKSSPELMLTRFI